MTTSAKNVQKDYFNREGKKSFEENANEVINGKKEGVFNENFLFHVEKRVVNFPFIKNYCTVQAEEENANPSVVKVDPINLAFG